MSILVDIFLLKISLTISQSPKPHNTACVLLQKEDRHWLSRSFYYSSNGGNISRFHTVHYHGSVHRHCSCFEECGFPGWSDGRSRWYIVFHGHCGFFHGLCQILILPGTGFVSEVFIEALSADTRHSEIKCDFCGDHAVLCFQSQKNHSLVLADFRRLAEEKALASSKNSFSALRCRISLSCSFTRLHSMVVSSEKLIALAGVWEPSPIVRDTILLHLYTRIVNPPNFELHCSKLTSLNRS